MTIEQLTQIKTKVEKGERLTAEDVNVIAQLEKKQRGYQDSADRQMAVMNLRIAYTREIGWSPSEDAIKKEIETIRTKRNGRK